MRERVERQKRKSWVLAWKLPVQEEGSGSHLIGNGGRSPGLKSWLSCEAVDRPSSFSRFPVLASVFLTSK